MKIEPPPPNPDSDTATDSDENAAAPTPANPLRRQILMGLAAAALGAAGFGAWRWSRPAGNDAIELAVVYAPDMDYSEFLTGVEVAARQVNAEGGILGRQIKLRLFEEESYDGHGVLEDVVGTTLHLATKIGRMDSVIAVIGHSSSATAIPASAVYDRHQKLYIATHATDSSLTNHRLDLTFALQPSNADNADMLAAYAVTQGWKRLVVLSDDTSYGRETADRFRSALARKGGTILHRSGLRRGNKTIDDLLLFILKNDIFKPSDIDAFFISSSSVIDSAQFIARTRTLGLTTPILGPEYLYSREISEMAGLKAMRGVVAASLYDSASETLQSKPLMQDFKALKSYEPGLMAALGYDAVKVLAYGINRCGKLDPAAIADTLRVMRYEAPFVGATGEIAFDSNGLITDTTAYVVRHDGTRFHTVAAFRKPLPNTEE